MGNLRNRSRKASKKRKAQVTDDKLVKAAKFTRETAPQEPSTSTPDVNPAPVPVVVRPIPESSLVDEGETPRSSRTAEQCSSSSKKLAATAGYSQDTDVEKKGFVLFSVDVLRNLFSLMCCPECKQQGSISLNEDVGKKQGVAISFILQCSVCLWEHASFSSMCSNM